MPYDNKWIPNELALEHGGVRVYRSYKNDCADEPLTFWFNLHPDARDEEAFDARDLRTWGEAAGKETPFSDRCHTAIKLAIEKGELTQKGVRR